jgi:hypothetical protein
VAERADDPLMVAAGARAMQQVLLGQGHLDEAITIADRAGQLVTPTDDAPVAQWCVWGTMQLIAAFAGARTQDHAESDRRWAAVDRAAERYGRDVQWESLWWGPSNVAIQQLARLVELYEPAAALDLADRMPDDPLPQVNRRVYHRLHRAKAHYLRRHDDEALWLLVDAERVAPEIVRYEPMTHEMVRAMLRRRRSRVPGEVRGLAERLQALAS